MVDIAIVGTATSIVKNIADLVKDISGIVKEKKDASLAGLLTDLNLKLNDLVTTIRELESENGRLKQALQQKEQMRFKEPFWFKEGDSVPHCPTCWEKHQLAVHLVRDVASDGVYYECRNPDCKFIQQVERHSAEMRPESYDDF